MWQTIKQSFAEFSSDKVPRLSAALAFYTMLSLAPLMIILMKIVSLFMKDKARSTVEHYVTSVSSEKTAQAIQAIFDQDAAQPSRGALASIVSLIILLVSASGVFGELQTSMNEIFDVQPRPNRGIMGTIKDRFFSMTLVLGVAFLLIVSLVISTILTGISHRLMPGASFLWQAVTFIVDIAIISALFALIFKYLPDIEIDWKPVWVGAIATAVLFTVGKFLLAWYLGKGSTVSAYGAMGSLVALLLWVYYSSMIVFFGAELTQAYAKQIGVEVRPSAKAMALREGSEDKSEEEKKEAEWYPAVPVRRELAVAQSATPVASGNGGGAGSKILMLAAGVAVGKFLLGGGGQGGKKLAVGRIVEPGFVTRRHRFENKEYVLKFRPPRFMSRAADSVGRGYRKVKDRIAEYVDR